MKAKWLLRLADKLQGTGPYTKTGPIPRNRFDMTQWVERFIPNSVDIVIEGCFILEKIPCGTAACACGWAGTDPWFCRRGFYTTTYGNVIFINDESEMPNAYLAAAKFFDIPHMDAIKLFSEDKKNRTPNQVANNIRRYVQKNEKKKNVVFIERHY